MAQAPKGMRARRPDSPGAKKNTSSLRTSVAEALREALGCGLNASSWFFCTHTAAYHLPAKAEKSVRLQRASATQCSTTRRGASKARFVSVDDCGLMLGAAWGHAMLACSGPATARSPNARMGPWGTNLATLAPLPGRNTFDCPARRPGQLRSSMPAVCVSQNAKSCSRMSSIGQHLHSGSTGQKSRRVKPADTFLF